MSLDRGGPERQTRVLKDAWFGRVTGVFALLLAPCILGAAVLLLLGPLIDAWRGARSPFAGWGPYETLGFLGAGAVLAYCAFLLFRAFVDCVTTITLDADSLTVRRPFAVRAVRRDELHAYAVITGYRQASRIRLLFKDADRRPVSFKAYDLGALEGWLEGIPTSTALLSEAALTSALADPRLGETVEERRRAIARMKTISTVIAWGGVALAGWIFIWPTPRDLAFGLGLGLVALALLLTVLLPARFSLFEREEAARAKGGALLLAGAAVGVRLLLETRLLEPMPVTLVLGPVLGAALIALLVGLGPEKGMAGTPAGWTVIVATLALWAIGAELEANVRFDADAPVVYRAAVLEKHVYHGRSDHWSVTLGPWALKPSGERIEDRRLYAQVSPGDSVCASVHPGALGMRWMTRAPCPTPPPLVITPRAGP